MAYYYGLLLLWPITAAYYGIPLGVQWDSCWERCRAHVDTEAVQLSDEPRHLGPLEGPCEEASRRARAWLAAAGAQAWISVRKS